LGFFDLSPVHAANPITANIKIPAAQAIQDIDEAAFGSMTAVSLGTVGVVGVVVEGIVHDCVTEGLTPP